MQVFKKEKTGKNQLAHVPEEQCLRLTELALASLSPVNDLEMKHDRVVWAGME